MKEQQERSGGKQAKMMLQKTVMFRFLKDMPSPFPFFLSPSFPLSPSPSFLPSFFCHLGKKCFA